MKKIISILLILCLLFVLGACNSTPTDTEKTTIANPDVQPVDIADVPLSRYLDNCAYFGRCNWNDFTLDEQRAISQKARDAQVTLNIDEAGVITLVDPSGIVVEYGGVWPTDNALIKDFPVPSNKVAYVYEQAGVICYVAVYMSMDEAKDYAKNFAALGYDKGVTEAENEKTYYYDAENAASGTADAKMALVVYEAGITLIGIMPVESV
ncbi:MAG: hypothetical protein IKY44_05545 [Clostridia bacterium]|nr:hypothetical protein [Clostridia bacterium]